MTVTFNSLSIRPSSELKGKLSYLENLILRLM